MSGFGTLPKKEYPKFPATVDASKKSFDVSGVFAGFWTGRTAEGEDTHQPVLFNNGNTPNVRYNLKATDYPSAGNTVAPGSFEWPHEFVKFGAAFGLPRDSVKAMLDENDPTTSLSRLSMALLQQKGIVHFNALSKDPSQGAWVKRIVEMKPVDAIYYGKFVRFTTRENGVAAHKLSQGNEKFPPREKALGLLQITIGRNAGDTVLFDLPYPLEPDINGIPAFLPQKKNPTTGVMEDRVDVARFKKFIRMVSGDPKFDQTFDPASCKDKGNVLPEIEAIAQAKGVMLSFKAENGFVGIDHLELMPDDLIIPAEPVKTAEQIETSQAANLLYKVIENRIGENPFLKDGKTFNDNAKNWLRSELTPLMDAMKIPHHSTKLLTTVQIVELLRALGEEGLAQEAATMKDNVSQDF